MTAALMRRPKEKVMWKYCRRKKLIPWLTAKQAAQSSSPSSRPRDARFYREHQVSP